MIIKLLMMSKSFKLLSRLRGQTPSQKLSNVLLDLTSFLSSRSMCRALFIFYKYILMYVLIVVSCDKFSAFGKEQTWTVCVSAFCNCAVRLDGNQNYWICRIHFCSMWCRADAFRRAQSNEGE